MNGTKNIQLPTREKCVKTITSLYFKAGFKLKKTIVYLALGFILSKVWYQFYLLPGDAPSLVPMGLLIVYLFVKPIYSYRKLRQEINAIKEKDDAFIKHMYVALIKNGSIKYP